MSSETQCCRPFKQLARLGLFMSSATVQVILKVDQNFRPKEISERVLHNETGGGIEWNLSKIFCPQNDIIVACAAVQAITAATNLSVALEQWCINKISGKEESLTSWNFEKVANTVWGTNYLCHRQKHANDVGSSAENPHGHVRRTDVTQRSSFYAKEIREPPQRAVVIGRAWGLLRKSCLVLCLWDILFLP